MRFEKPAKRSSKSLVASRAPGDPIIVDPDKDEPTKLDPMVVGPQILDGMRQAGIPAHLIYAYEKTGLMLMEGREYSKAVRSEYNAAIDEYFYLKDVGKLPKGY
jgi:hypothetical protein